MNKKDLDRLMDSYFKDFFGKVLADADKVLAKKKAK